MSSPELELRDGTGSLERRAADTGAAADAGGDDGDPDLARQPVVDGGAEDDVRVLGRSGTDRLRGLVHLDQRHVVAAGDREQDPGSAGDLLVDQRRAERALGGFLRAVLAARGEADAHQGGARVLHDRAHVGEVEVDQPGHRDQVADTLDALAQHVVGDLERIEHRRRAVQNLEEAVVRDHDRRVARLAQQLHADVRLPAPLRSLELERRRDDPDCERAQLARDLRNDRRTTGAGTAALTRSDEHHVRSAQRMLQLVVALVRRTAADVRVRA